MDGSAAGVGQVGAEERAELRRRAMRDNIINPRAVAAGLMLAGLLALSAIFYRLAVGPAAFEKRKPPAEFQFGVADPRMEEIRFRQPTPDILRERPETMNPNDVVEVSERPNMHYTTDPTNTAVPTSEFIQSKQVDIDTPIIEVGGREMTAVEDAPLQISEVSEAVTWALPVIAVQTAGPADIFKYDHPTPRDKLATHYINAAPRPGRPVSMLPKAFGDQNQLGTGQLGPMNINLNGTGLYFRNATGQFFDLRARSAVDNALNWLAMHQETDGTWQPEKYEGEKSATLADTGLALLALMGGGSTTRKGEHMRCVLRGLEALMREQGPDGGFYKKSGGSMYTHAICTIALCEAYGRARDQRVGDAAQKAVAFCEKNGNTDGGWRYQPKGAESDMSVSAWFLQALKTAKLAQLKFDNKVFSQALTFLDSVTDKGASKESTGGVGYTFQAGQEYGHGHPALTAAGMMVRQFSGIGVKNHLLVSGARLTQNLPPDWRKKDFYYWYYATYAMHNMGGEYRIWWNKRIRDVLLDNQMRTGEHAGSWDPLGDRWGKTGGRVYTTALGALCLEVYYRYSEALNSFGTAPELDELFFEK